MKENYVKCDNENNRLLSQDYGFLNESKEVVRANPITAKSFKSYDMTMFINAKVPWD